MFTTRLLIENIIKFNQNILGIVDQDFSNYMNEVDYFAMGLRNDERFIKIIFIEGLTPENEQYIENRLIEMLSVRDDIEQLVLYIPEIDKSYTLFSAASQVVSEDIDVKFQKWYIKAANSWNYTYLEPSVMTIFDTGNKNQSDHNLFTLTKSFLNISNGRSLGILKITFNDNIFYRLSGGNISMNPNLMNIHSASDSSKEEMIILDDQNNPFFLSNTEHANTQNLASITSQIPKDSEQGSYQVVLNFRTYLAVYKISAIGNWKYIKLIPMETINTEVQGIGSTNLLMGLVIILLLNILIMIISKKITRPLENLTQQMKQAGSGNFKASITVTGNDEISLLADRFNDQRKIHNCHP